MSSTSMVAAPMQFVPHETSTNVVAGIKRPRSNTAGSTSSSRRTKSRASTTSLVSSSNQSLCHHRQSTEQPHGTPVQRGPSQPYQYTAEEMITRSEQQLTNPNLAYTFEPSLGRPGEHPGNTYTHERGTRPRQDANIDPAIQRPSLYPHHSYEGDSYAFEHVNGEQGIGDNGPSDGRKKKGNASSIANDLELKKLFRDNAGRSLKEVAAQILANERGPRSEKTKQIFAMLWLSSSCRKGNNSVPRTRVFAHYATRCGTERVPPLNCASFGKLVRIIFPGLSTRRLGIRGASRYHYVDLTLLDDHPETDAAASTAWEAYTETERSKGSQLPADTAVFPSPDMPSSSTFGALQDRSQVPECRYVQTTPGNMQNAPSRPNMVNYELKFSRREDPSYRDDESVILPSIHNYVPVGTDPDTAEGLAALYRTHCISVIDSFRFCKERMLWHHFTSFHGLLAVPLQKLFAHPDMAAWIKECDWLMYQKMVQFVSPLALQVVPIRVIDTFRAISTKLATHLMLTFQNHSQHVRDAKLGPATVFAGLLDRLLRVNATAHAAANMLTNDANRDQMWHDWVLYVKPLKVAESSLPGVGYQRTLRILATEMRHLLGPLRTTTYGGMDPIYSETLGDPPSTHSSHGHPELDDNSTEGVLDRWTRFLHRLPSLFPRADARTLLHCAGAVGNAALRDITIAQALSFGSWWVTKTWVDEMLLWTAEKGGFIEHTPDTVRMRGRRDTAAGLEYPADDASDIFGGSRPRTAVSESADPPSRYGSVDVGSNAVRDQSPRANHPFQGNRLGRRLSRVAPMAPPMQGRHDKAMDMSRDQNPDDSGIVMEPEHDDLRKEHYSGFVADGANLGSDPADVVVC
ncbi:MAG: hypothetical protein LQ348_001084 [Seirophora lacunosa]|nr:MAG: hypothetical protein LQ348_001084 [Seirophora lacunosa]